jgi:hypothetical protein
MTKKRIILLSIVLALLLAFGAFYLTSYFGANMSWVSGYYAPIEGRRLELRVDERDGYYTFLMPSDGSDFRILQVSDTHLTASMYYQKRDKRMFDMLYKLISDTKPDIIIITGDLLHPSLIESGMHNNGRQIKAFAAFMERLGVRWTLTYGNHEFQTAVWDKSQVSEYLEGLENCLFQRGPADLKGMGNSVIKLENVDGTLNSAIFTMDSGGYQGSFPLTRKYDNIGDCQIAWFEQETLRLNAQASRQVPSHVFFHIPLQEFAAAWTLYEEGSTDVTHFFGTRQEGPSVSPFGNNLFDKMVELGSTKAVYVGHDHLNDFSIEYKGIRLTHCLSLDHIAYFNIISAPFMRAGGKIKRGGLTIDIDTAGGFELARVIL